MIDYSETVLALQTGARKLLHLLLKRQWKTAINVADDLIIALIDLKWWLRKQDENNQ